MVVIAVYLESSDLVLLRRKRTNPDSSRNQLPSKPPPHPELRAASRGYLLHRASVGESTTWLILPEAVGIIRIELSEGNFVNLLKMEYVEIVDLYDRAENC